MSVVNIFEIMFLFFNFHILDSQALYASRYTLQFLHCLGCIHMSYLFVIDAKWSQDLFNLVDLSLTACLVIF